jgi:hypothetical protein
MVIGRSFRDFDDRIVIGKVAVIWRWNTEDV